MLAGLPPGSYAVEIAAGVPRRNTQETPAWLQGRLVADGIPAKKIGAQAPPIRARRERDDRSPELKALSVPTTIIPAPDSPLARRWRLRPEFEPADPPD